MDHLKTFIKEQIYGEADKYKNLALRQRHSVSETEIELIDLFVQMLLEEKTADLPDIVKCLSGNYPNIERLFTSILIAQFSDQDNLTSFNPWDHSNPLIRILIQLLSGKYQLNKQLIWTFVAYKITYESGPKIEEFIHYILDSGIETDELIKKTILNIYHDFHYIMNRNDQVKTKKMTGFAEFLIPQLSDKKAVLGLVQKKGKAHLLNDLALNYLTGYVFYDKLRKLHIMKFLFEHCPQALEGKFDQYIIYTDDDDNQYPIIENINFLLHQDPVKFESYAVKALNIPNFESNLKFDLLIWLNTHFKNKYVARITALGEKHLNFYTTSENDLNEQSGYSSEMDMWNVPEKYSKFLLEQNQKSGFERIKKYIVESNHLTESYLKFIESEFNSEAVPLLIESLKKDPKLVDTYRSGYFENTIEMLGKYDVSAYLDTCIEFALNTSIKKYKVLMCELLSKYGDRLTDKVHQMLLNGKVEERIVGALIMQNSLDENSKKLLFGHIDIERNDDVRDILLETLKDLFNSQPFYFDEILRIINQASKRNKLTKWSEKWLIANELPSLFWKASGLPLNEEEVKFIFYRIKRMKGLLLDPELQQMFQHLDLTKSTKFALHLIKAFKDSNLDNTIKNYVTFAAHLGGGEVLQNLYNIFKSSISAKRMALAEYLVGSIAMVGSNKALRMVESISRQYANKKPKVAAVAREALQAAAESLKISPDQIADRIVPDFGFENNYFPVELHGEVYRAFINREFKINFFDPDNNLRKSIPKGLDPVIQSELKSIEKEVKEVIKNQSHRLEKYLIEERRWDVDEWINYYKNNPIMINYVQKLLWGLYDPNGKLQSVFYCDDDLELNGINDEEISLEKTYKIGILHPLHLDEDTLQKWKDKLFDQSFEFEFPVLDRPVIRKQQDEMEQSFSKAFYDSSVKKGADFVAGFLLRKGWIKYNGDGGYLTFEKINHSQNVRAEPYIEGPAAYYQGGNEKAIVKAVAFYEITKPTRVKIKDVPDVFYSEVMADLSALINA